MVDYLDWNSRLFDGLVVRVGRPNDPLFLYVDAELLAQVGGGGTPDEALTDFKRAWQGSFEAPYRAALRWRREGYLGSPPFVHALAMTVLAVTLDPIGGSTANVYRRQRDLLGLPTDGGVPPGYEDSVPGMWRIWNEWLRGPGNQFGVPTAQVVGGYTLQGWARSQAFIRPRDRQDIYEFFGDASTGRSVNDTGVALAHRLESWLRAKPRVNQRLLRVSEDLGLREELAQCLLSMLRYWSGEQVERTRPARLPASFHWDDESQSPSLIVKVAEVRGAVGTRITDLGLQEYEIQPGEPFVFLTEASASAVNWMTESIVDWPLARMWTVSWAPRRSYLLEAAFDGQWIETDVVAEDRKYRVLCDQSFVDSNTGWQTVPSTVPGHMWLTKTGALNLSAQDVSKLAGPERATRVRQKKPVNLEGGLPLGGSRFLVGGEPDIRITNVSDLESVTVDSLDCLADLLPGRGDLEGLVLPMWTLRLPPGEHQVSVTTAGVRSTFDFSSSDPSFGLSDLSEAPTSANSSASSFVPVRPGVVMIAIDREGTCWGLEPAPDARLWIRELGLERFERLERNVDLSVSELLSSDQLLIASRRGRTKPWYVCRRGGNADDLRRFRLEAFPLAPESAIVLELIASPRNFEDDLARIQLTQAINSMRGNRRSSVRRTVGENDRDAAPVKIRSDVQVGGQVDNPFDWFLFWLTELGDRGATTLMAERAWSWLRKSFSSGSTEYKESLTTLQALGHVEWVGRGRVHVSPPRARLMPDSEGLSVITGARSDDLLSSLRSGADDDAAAPQQEALQELVSYELAQVEGTRPLGPTTVYVRFDQRDPEAQAAHLGISLNVGESHKLLDRAAGIRDRISSAMAYRQPRGVRWDEFVPTDHIPGGKWRHRAGLPESGQAFLRAASSRSTEYLWWDASAGDLRTVGWVVGLWAFQSLIARRGLLIHIPAHDRFAVRVEWAPLPADIQLALTLRTGLLPQAAALPDAGGGWRLFDNVSSQAANKVAALLQQELAMRTPQRMES